MKEFRDCFVSKVKDMPHTTTFEEFSQSLTQSHSAVIARETYADLYTPIRVFQLLAKHQDDAILLDSSYYKQSDEACIYIGFEPYAEFTSIDQMCYITEAGQKRQTEQHPLEALREFYYKNRCHSPNLQTKFAGGMIGFYGYHAVNFIEVLPDRHANLDQVPDLYFKFYATNIVFDKRTGKVTIALVVPCDGDARSRYDAAMLKINRILKEMVEGSLVLAKSQSSNADLDLTIKSNLDDKAYTKIVERAKHYIRQGDAFQIVASRCFQTPYRADDFDLYRALRILNPSPYHFFIRSQEFTVVGASPEKLVSLQQGIVETMPIAGTRPRGATPAEDLALEEELLKDEKELAEHTMLVDLGRNDLGAICEPGSVRVKAFKIVHKYSRVMHIVSLVDGTIKKDLDAFDALRACFPAGTLTGAPKIRAMEIIDDIEIARRGVYGGAICAFDNEGQLDSCITIRTAFIKNDVATICAGAGIVLDSIPEKEADETRHKAQAVLDAIQLAKRGLA